MNDTLANRQELILSQKKKKKKVISFFKVAETNNEKGEIQASDVVRGIFS